ncbi:MAG TPA: beta-propeller fold lactonase family protein [Vicinamibacterales bacterium]|nr:beta-propeller fold lactonase family protein [Vicinamibacterales bacterium]
MPHRLTRLVQASQIYAVVGLAIAPMIVAALADSVGGAPQAALYASVGEELITFSVDLERATLARQSSMKLPGFVQEAWASPSAPFLYVAWSNGGASYAGTGVAPRGDQHGVTAFRVDDSGALHAQGAPAALRSRPIHITGDASGRHLLVAYNDPSGISVHDIKSDGSVGAEVPQPAGLDVGIYAHQVRVMPGNKGVILVTRGNQATSTTREDPGAVKVLRYDDGKLANVASIAPGKGIEFRSRHLDFHPTGPWVFLTLESQNKLDVFRRTGDTLNPEPLFSKSTLASGGGVTPGQTTSTVHVHPNGQFVYVGNRGAAGGLNEIAVFAINQQTGEPSLIQNIDTHGTTPRTFSLDPSARLLVVGNQTSANLSVFRIRADGKLDYVNRYDIAVGGKPLWWAGLVRLP